MSVFIDTFDRELINIDHVKRISFREYTGDRLTTVRCEMIDDNNVSFKMGETAAYALRDRLSRVVVPAQPGFTFLAYYFSKDEEWISRSPIIAWGVDHLSFLQSPRPIPIIRPGQNVTTTGVLFPDGQVSGDEGTFSSEEDWVKDSREIVERERAAKETAGAAA